MRLSTQQFGELECKGFLRIDGMAELSEVSEIRNIMDELLARKAGLQEGAFFDMLSPGGEQKEMKLLQIRNASDYAAALARTRFSQNAKALAQQILGPKAKLWFDMLILKPARSNAGTPWHQDEAFCDPKFEHKEITFWMPLQDATEENGCMRFIEGSHNGSVLTHRSPGNDPTVHALECCEDFETEQAVTCPMPAGSCSIHYGRTLHSAGGNQSDQPRYAYILGFHIPPSPSLEVRNFPWLTEKRTGDSALTRAWLLRGGMLSIVRRKIRRGEFFSWDSLRYGVRRTFSLLLG